MDMVINKDIKKIVKAEVGKEVKRQTSKVLSSLKKRVDAQWGDCPCPDMPARRRKRR